MSEMQSLVSTWRNLPREDHCLNYQVSRCGEKLVFVVLAHGVLTWQFGEVQPGTARAQSSFTAQALPVSRGVTAAHLSQALTVPACAFRSRVCVFILFQDLGVPTRKRKASTSLTDDEGLSLVSFAIPSRALSSPVGVAMASRTAAGHEQEPLGPLRAGCLGGRWALPPRPKAPGCGAGRGLSTCPRAEARGGRGARGKGPAGAEAGGREGAAHLARPQVTRASAPWRGGPRWATSCCDTGAGLC